MKTGVGATDMDTERSDAVVGSTMMELRLVLLEGAGSARVEFVTVAEL